jgi:hypothetical protein
MQTEIIPHSGWERNLRLANNQIELVVTLDVGPRIISLRRKDGTNVFKTFNEQLGGTGETEWMIRGGHRFWIAPEDVERTYHIDNQPPRHRVDSTTGEFVFEAEQQSGGRILKTLGITISPDSPRVRVRHTAKNTDSKPLEFSAWALSVMKAGGTAVIPQPPLGEHPRDLLPNRTMVLWPYTDLSDARWRIGREYFILRQAADRPPTKIGLAHREKQVAYIVDDSIFIKSFDFIEGETYPDGGCNFEAFTNGDMLEVESLSPLRTVPPGGEITHIEEWTLLPFRGSVSTESDVALRQTLAPYLTQAAI